MDQFDFSEYKNTFFKRLENIKGNNDALLEFKNDIKKDFERFGDYWANTRELYKEIIDLQIKKNMFTDIFPQ